MRPNRIFAPKSLGAAVLIALIAGALSIYWQGVYWPDLNPPICSARKLLAGLEPYAGCATDYGGRPAAQYPLTTILAFLPFAGLPGPYAAAAIWAAMHFLLAVGILRAGQPWRFWIFLSGPYALAFVFHQFSPLIAAVMLLPGLLPLALIKPQTGLPIILTHLTRRRAAVCAAFVALTFVVYPAWPWAWWQSAQGYDGVIPLLALPLGPLVALSLLPSRTKEDWTVFLFACLPQRSIYDLVPLMALGRSKTQTILLVGLSWLPVALLAAGVPESAHGSLAFIYLPLTVLSLLPKTPRRSPSGHLFLPRFASDSGFYITQSLS